MTLLEKCCSLDKCHTCGSKLITGSAKHHWYCAKHWKIADSKALVEDFPQYYHLDKRGLAVGNI